MSSHANRHTDRPRYSGNNRPRLMICMAMPYSDSKAQISSSAHVVAATSSEGFVVIKLSVYLKQGERTDLTN